MSAAQSTGAGTPDTAAGPADTAAGPADTAAGLPDTQDYAGELGGFVLARSAVDRVSARRADTDWLAAAWADPATRVLVLENARALVRFGDKEAELVLGPPAEAPEGLRFLLGVDDAEVAYFGVMGPPGCLEPLTATETTADPSITGEAGDAAPADAPKAPAEDGPQEEAPGETAGGTEAEVPAVEAAPGEAADAEAAAAGVPAAGARAPAEAPEAPAEDGSQEEAPGETAGGTEAEVPAVEAAPGEAADAEAAAAGVPAAGARAPAEAPEAPAEDGSQEEAPGETAGGTEAEVPAVEAAPGEAADAEAAAAGVPAAGARAPAEAPEAPAEDGSQEEAPRETAGGTEAEVPAVEAAPGEAAPGEAAPGEAADAEAPAAGTAVAGAPAAVAPEQQTVSEQVAWMARARPGQRPADLREAAALLNDRDAGLFTHAVALANWHATHTHCPRCGSPTVTVAAGHAQRCPADGSEHFPRIDPAVIMLVTDPDDRCLLARNRRWPERRVSILAGFVEPGESAEQAVAREVGEETGITVARVRYVGSQPWPMPQSLMLGFRASASGDLELRVDDDEIAEAHWFSRDELRSALASQEILLPPPVSIAHRLIESWYGEELPGVW